MKRQTCILTMGACLILAFGRAEAGAVPDRGVGVHISPVQSTNSCAPDGVTSLFSFRSQEWTFSTPTGPFYFVYLLGCNRPDSAGLGGLECGIQYPGGYKPVTSKLAVADCGGAERLITNPFASGIVGFDAFGWGGCLVDPLPVEATTWGRIKSSLDR